MKGRSTIPYFCLSFILALSVSLSGCARRFDESMITAGNQDPLWRAYAIRGQAFENCGKAAPASVGVPVQTASSSYAKPKQARKSRSTARTAPKAAAKKAAATPAAELFPPDLECPPGCVPASRINPAVVVPLTQPAPAATSTTAPTVTPALPETPPPAVPPAPTVPANSMTTPVPSASSSTPEPASAFFPETSVPGQATQPPVQSELKEEAPSAPAPVPVPVAAGTLGATVPMPAGTPP